jgi:hypothetical protein
MLPSGITPTRPALRTVEPRSSLDLDLDLDLVSRLTLMSTCGIS